MLEPKISLFSIWGDNAVITQTGFINIFFRDKIAWLGKYYTEIPVTEELTLSISSLLQSLRKTSKQKIQTGVKSPLLNDQTRISPNLSDNLNWLQDCLGHASDLVIKDLTIGQISLQAIYLEDLVRNDLINNLLYSLMVDSNALFEGQEDLFKFVKQKILNSGQVREVTTLGSALEAVVFGETVLFFAGYPKALVMETKSWESRSIEEAEKEATLRGPRDGFNENIMTNLALIRRRLRDPGLRVYRMILGERTNTPILILYLQDIAKQEILDELLERINKVEIDGVLESGILEQLIEDNVYSPFPQILLSERPDKAVAHLLEGRFVILVDATPFALIVPATMAQFISSPEDYYERWITSSAIRLVRYAAVFVSMFLPAIYIALTSFHYHLIPSRLINQVAQTRNIVPFTPFTEAVIMELTLELLREASVRLPGRVGQTIGVVGGIIVGNAAIQAGLFSPLLVIVVALTAISTFIIPNYNFGLAVRFLRFPIAFISALFGGFGIIMAWIILTTHLVTLESFGVPYTSPFAPLRLGDLKDTLVRVPINYMIKRPKSARAQDKKGR